MLLTPPSHGTLQPKGRWKWDGDGTNYSTAATTNTTSKSKRTFYNVHAMMDDNAI